LLSFSAVPIGDLPAGGVAAAAAAAGTGGYLLVSIGSLLF
jgi:hypothetical protein